MIVYGRNPVREALRGRRRVQRVWATERAAREVWLGGVEVAERGGARSRSAAARPSTRASAPRSSPIRYADADALLAADDALVLCLDEVQDPHNLGAVCRVAEAAGLPGVVIPERRSAAVTPAVCKASAGAVEHLAVARVRNLADWLGEAKEAGAWVYGAAADGARGLRPARLPRPGRAGAGLRGEGAAARAWRRLRRAGALPLRGRVGSLNVSTAAAALVYGILQLRGRA